MWLIQQNSDPLIRSAGCRWARRGVHSGLVGEGNAGYVSGASLCWPWPRVLSPSATGALQDLMQVGGYRPQFRPHRGVIWPVLISGLLELPLQVLSPNPTGPWRFSMRIQITPRCALIERIGQLTTGLSWRWLSESRCNLEGGGAGRNRILGSLLDVFGDHLVHVADRRLRALLERVLDVELHQNGETRA